MTFARARRSSPLQALAFDVALRGANFDLAAVALTLRQKQDFYYELGQLVRSGVAFPAAVQTLSHESTGAAKRLLLALNRALQEGATVAEAFARQPAAVSSMETSLIAACERSGRLDQGCQRLSDYFAALAQAREMVIRKSLYPLFILHFGILTMGLPRIFLGGGVRDYLEHTIGALAAGYGCAALIWFVCKEFARLARTSVALDRLWRTLPVVGAVHSWFSLARFCATYEMQLNSGVNVMESLTSAATVSQSATIRRGIERLMREVRTGAQVGPLLGKSGAFPAEMIRTFRIGEQTGGLDEELRRLTEGFERRAVARVETLSEWVPRLGYVLILVYLGWEIVAGYQKTVSGYKKCLIFKSHIDSYLEQG